jgi:osmoprotectant transport system ATP-binding protein
VNESSAAQPAIAMRDVDVSRGAAGQVLRGLSLEIAAGETVALVGRSGAGKTTALKLINGLIVPDAGDVIIEGRSTRDWNPFELRRRIGYVLQEIGLFPHMSVAENVAIVPRLLAWEPARIEARVTEMLQLVGLAPETYAGRAATELSGGQRQRVGVARALAADPPAMLMDEPFGAIDPITRERLQDAFLELQARIGKTIVLVTHDLGEALKLGDRIAMLGQRATLVQYDTPEAILAEPADEFVASFVGTGAAMRRLRLVEVGSIALRPAGPADAGGATVRSGQSLYEALDAMLRAGTETATVLDEDGHPAGTVSWSTIVRETPPTGGGR